MMAQIASAPREEANLGHVHGMPPCAAPKRSAFARPRRLRLFTDRRPIARLRGSPMIWGRCAPASACIWGNFRLRLRRFSHIPIPMESLDQPGAGRACCGRKTDLLFIRANVRTARGVIPTEVVLQERCARCVYQTVFTLNTHGTHWMGRIRAAARRGDISFEAGTLSAPEAGHRLRNRPPGDKLGGQTIPRRATRNPKPAPHSRRLDAAQRLAIELTPLRLPPGWQRPSTAFLRSVYSGKNAGVLQRESETWCCGTYRDIVFLRHGPQRDTMTLAHECAVCRIALLETVWNKPSQQPPLRLRA